MGWDFAASLSEWGPRSRGGTPVSLARAPVAYLRAASPRIALRELHRRLAAAAAAAGPALPRRVRLLPLVRRPRRRDGRRAGGARPHRVVARRTAARATTASPRHPVMVALRETIRRFDIPPRAVPEPARRLRAGPAREAVRHVRPAPRLLPQLGEPGRPARAVPVRVLRRRSGRRWPTRSAPGCNWRTSGRTWPATSPSAASTCPDEDRRRFGYADADLAARRFTPAFARADAVRGGPGARVTSTAGKRCCRCCRGRRGVDVDLFIRGGRAILRAIERAGYDVWTRRPEVSKWEKAKLLAARPCAGCSISGARRSAPPTPGSPSPRARGRR